MEGGDGGRRWRAMNVTMEEDDEGRRWREAMEAMKTTEAR
jgi:hypothetical protein